jgi:hypothetical protein
MKDMDMNKNQVKGAVKDTADQVQQKAEKLIGSNDQHCASVVATLIINHCNGGRHE